MVDFVPTAEVEAWIQRVNFQTPRVHVSNPEYHKGGMLSKGYLDFDFTTTLPNGESYSSRHRFSEIETIRETMKKRYMPLGVFVPYTPSKGLLQNNADTNSTFIKERMRGLILFCNHMFSNPFIANDSDWLSFMGSKGSSDNEGLTMLRSALHHVEQPFKFTIVNRIDAIKAEVTAIEGAMKSQLSSLREVEAAEKALNKAYDVFHTSMTYFNQGEVHGVKCLNGVPFDTTDSIINPEEMHVKHSVACFDNLCLGVGVCSAAPRQALRVVLIPAVEHEYNQMSAFKEMLKIHEDLMLARGTLILKLEKEETGQNQAKIEDYKQRLQVADENRSLFYKGFIYFTIMMYARHRQTMLRQAYSDMAVVKLAESSQQHNASLDFFRSMRMHPETATTSTNAILSGLGLTPLTPGQINLNGENFPEIPDPLTPQMSGLYEAAISGNYGPLQVAPPGAPPIPQASFLNSDGFSDDEGDRISNSMSDTHIEDLQSGGASI